MKNEDEIMQNWSARVKTIFISALCLLCACTDGEETNFSGALLEGLRSLGTKSETEAFIVHNDLYERALVLEKKGGVKHLNLDRVIGSLALRRAMLAEVTGRQDEVYGLINEAKQRFGKGGLLPKDFSEIQREELFANLVLTTLEIEKPKWGDALYKSWETKNVFKNAKGKK